MTKRFRFSEKTMDWIIVIVLILIGPMGLLWLIIRRDLEKYIGWKELGS